MLRPCPRGKVKWHDVRVISIGQLAGYVGVSTKTIRVYHDKGLLPEPDRDASGYRRYGANDAIDLIKIRTLAEAGVPLARIRELRSATEEEFQQALREIDDQLTARIQGLRHLAHPIAHATRARYGPDQLPALHDDSAIPALIQGTVNASSPAWERLDGLIRAELGA